MSGDQVAQVLERWFEVAARGNAGDILALLSDEFVLKVMPRQPVSLKHDGNQDRLKATSAYVEAPIPMIAGNDLVAVSEISDALLKNGRRDSAFRFCVAGAERISVAETRA